MLIFGGPVLRKIADTRKSVEQKVCNHIEQQTLTLESSRITLDISVIYRTRNPTQKVQLRY